MKIYLVCSGAYRTQAVFSNKEDADKLAAVLDGNVEEYDLDICLENVQKGEKPYYVYNHTYQSSWCEDSIEVRLTETIPAPDGKLEVFYRNSAGTSRSFCMNLWAKDDDEAKLKFQTAKEEFLRNEKK